MKNLANYYLVTSNCSGAFALLLWSSMSLSRAILEYLNVLHGLKENVIVGRLIPAGTGDSTFKYSKIARERDIELQSSKAKAPEQLEVTK